MSDPVLPASAEGVKQSDKISDTIDCDGPTVKRRRISSVPGRYELEVMEQKKRSREFVNSLSLCLHTKKKLVPSFAEKIIKLLSCDTVEGLLAAAKELTETIDKSIDYEILTLISNYILHKSIDLC